MSTSRYATEIDLTDLNNSHTLAILSIPPGSRVLDIGAADGSVARALVERGCTVYAVEIDPASAHEAEEHCEQVVVADVEELDVQAAFGRLDFDAVLLLDVLEHLREPVAVLRKVTRVVGPDGRLIVSIPNVAHVAVRLALLNGRFRYTELGLLDRTHLRFFDKAAVDQLLTDAGLVVHEELCVTRGATETEIPIDASAFPPEVVAEATRDPESQIYQFVVVAVAGGHEGAKIPSSLADALKQRMDDLERDLQKAASHARSLKAQLATKDVQLAELESTCENLSELGHVVRRQDAELLASRREVRLLHQDLALKEKYLAELRAAMAGREHFQTELATLAAMQSSLSWRMTSPLRSIRRQLRRHLGGTSARPAR